MMYFMKHLMTLHPEYYDMIKPFYDQLYEKYPYNEQDPFNFDDDKPRPKTSIEQHLDDLVKLNQKEIDKDASKSLDQMVWDLGLRLPSWNLGDNNKKKGNDND